MVDVRILATRIHNNYTNKLLSLPDSKEVFPAMPIKRRDTTAVTSKEHLIVAGGTVGWLVTERINIVATSNGH